MIAVNELRDVISYDAETGRLTWLIDASNNAKAGSPAFAAKKNTGHLHGRYKRKAYSAHRTAWALHYGEWPSQHIDHINGIRDDNRIENLRIATPSDNAMNRRPNNGKSSKLPHGVSVKKNGRFFAQIQKDGRNHHLGYFGTPEEAAEAYNTAANQMGFHDNHGVAILRAYRSVVA